MRGKHSIVGIVAVLMLGYVIGSCTPDTTGGASTPPGVLLDAKLVSNPARVDLAGTGTWVPLPSATATISVTTTPASLLVRFWASVACSGTGAKYALVKIDGTSVATTPLASLPPTVGTQSEISSTIQASRSVSTGTHTVSVEVKIDDGSDCAILPDLWHLDTELLAV